MREASYADYGHGIRFVHPTTVVDGQERAIADVAHNPELCALVSDGEPLRSVRAATPFA